MRSVRRAIWTSGDPVSPFLVAYSFTSCCLRSALSDIGYLSSLEGDGSGGGRDVVQPGRAKTAKCLRLLPMASLIHQIGVFARKKIALQIRSLEDHAGPEKLNPRTGCSSPLSMRPTAIRCPLQVA